MTISDGYSLDYPVETREGQTELLKLLPQIRDEESFFDELIQQSHWIFAGLSDLVPDRTKRKAARKELVKLSAKLESTRDALLALDGIAKDEILRRAGGRGQRWREKGKARVDTLAHSLERLEEWARDAAFFQKAPTGAPKKDINDEAMRTMKEIWEKYTEKPATIITNPSDGSKYGPFLEFCEFILTPIYEARSLTKPSFQFLAQKHIYPADNKGKKVRRK